MGVVSVRRRRVTLASNQPTGPMIGISLEKTNIHVKECLEDSPISFVVTRNNIQENHELANVSNISEANSDCGEHSPKICWSYFILRHET